MLGNHMFEEKGEYLEMVGGSWACSFCFLGIGECVLVDLGGNDKSIVLYMLFISLIISEFNNNRQSLDEIIQSEKTVKRYSVLDVSLLAAFTWYLFRSTSGYSTTLTTWCSIILRPGSQYSCFITRSRKSWFTHFRWKYISKLRGSTTPVDSIAAAMEAFHLGSPHHCPSNSVPNVPGRHKQLQLTGYMFTL